MATSPLSTLIAGDTVTLLVRGAGTTSEESHVVERVTSTSVWVDGYEYDLVRGQRLEPSAFGFSFQLQVPTPAPNAAPTTRRATSPTKVAARRGRSPRA